MQYLSYELSNWRKDAEFINILDHIEEESNDMIVDNDNIVRFLRAWILLLFAIYIFRIDGENIRSKAELPLKDMLNKNMVTLPLNLGCFITSVCFA